MKRVKWGVLGTANIAKNSVIPAIISTEGHIISSVASRTMTNARQFAKEFDISAVEGYESLLNDPSIDAVYIPLPTGLHFEWAMKALEADKHVLLEKSAVVNLDEAELLVSKARSKNLLLMEHFQFQYHNQHDFVKKLLGDGRIGEIRAFKSSFGFPPFGGNDNIRYKQELGGGALLDAGAYTIKAITFVLGFGFNVDTSFLINHEDFGIDWYGGGQLSCPDKNLFGQVAFGFDNFYQCSYEIWGSRGKLICPRAYTAKPNFSPTIILESPNGTEEIGLEPDNHFQNIIMEFSRLITKMNFEGEYRKIIEQARLIDQFRDKNTNA